MKLGSVEFLVAVNLLVCLDLLPLLHLLFIVVLRASLEFLLCIEERASRKWKLSRPLAESMNRNSVCVLRS